jgi:hypothetical protein
VLTLGRVSTRPSGTAQGDETAHEDVESTNTLARVADSKHLNRMPMNGGAVIYPIRRPTTAVAAVIQRRHPPRRLHDLLVPIFEVQSDVLDRFSSSFLIGDTRGHCFPRSDEPEDGAQRPSPPCSCNCSFIARLPQSAKVGSELSAGTYTVWTGCRWPRRLRVFLGREPRQSPAACRRLSHGRLTESSASCDCAIHHRITSQSSRGWWGSLDGAGACRAVVGGECTVPDVGRKPAVALHP